MESDDEWSAEDLWAEEGVVKLGEPADPVRNENRSESAAELVEPASRIERHLDEILIPNQRRRERDFAVEGHESNDEKTYLAYR